MNEIEKWDKRFLELAKHVASWSKDPSTKVGAVIFDKDYRIVSLGYNGFARRVEDTPERLNNREVKYRMVLHAEMNAILFANRKLDGHMIATWPFMPCSNCAATIIQSGITRCIAPEMNDELKKRWSFSCDLATEMFEEAGVKLKLYNE